MSGYVRIYRTLWDHPLFQDGVEAGAFAWMVCAAAWRATNVRYKNRMIDLKRGQLAVSVRDLAARFAWSPAKAERYIGRLKAETMVETATETGVIVITICNYDDYQPSHDGSETANETPIETAPRQERDRSETQNKEGKEGNLGGGGDAPPREDADPVTEPATPSGTDPFQPDARTVVARFHHLRRDLWPTETKFPAPDLTLLTQAADYLKGAPLALVLDVVERGMRTAAAEGRPSTHSLKAFCRSMANAAVTHRKSLGGAHGTDQPRPRPQRPGYDPDESRRRTLAAFPDLVDRAV